MVTLPWNGWATANREIEQWAIPLWIPFVEFVAICKCDGHTNILWWTYFCEYTTLTTGLKGQDSHNSSYNKISLSYGTIKVKIKDNNSLCSSKWSLSQIYIKIFLLVYSVFIIQ